MDSKHEQIVKKLLKQAVATVIVGSLEPIMKKPEGDMDKEIAKLHTKIHDMVNDAAREVLGLLGDYAQGGASIAEVVSKMAEAPLDFVEKVAKENGFDLKKKPNGSESSLEDEIVGGFNNP